jgi:hypothetical protein
MPREKQSSEMAKVAAAKVDDLVSLCCDAGVTLPPMFSSFADLSSPVVNWITVHSPLVAVSVATLIAFAAMVRFAQPSADGGFDDWFGDFD